jgi:hypothetical protein
MTRTLSALFLAIGLAFPAPALTIDLSLPRLSFPEPVTTPSTKGCDTAQDTSPCPQD